jgi:hypothetical protein
VMPEARREIYGSPCTLPSGQPAARLLQLWCCDRRRCCCWRYRSVNQSPCSRCLARRRRRSRKVFFLSGIRTSEFGRRSAVCSFVETCRCASGFPVLACDENASVFPVDAPFIVAYDLAEVARPIRNVRVSLIVAAVELFSANLSSSRCFMTVGLAVSWNAV